MGKAILLLGLMFNLIQVHGQADTTVVPFVAYWQVGDSYNFKISKFETQTQNGLVNKADTTFYYVNFKVIDSSEVGYKILWTYAVEEQFEIANKEPDMDNSELPYIIYSTDELGSFVEIENWEKVAENLITGLKEQLDKISTEEGKQMILDLYSSKESLELYVFKEIVYLHGPFGFEYEVGEVVEFEEELPNIFGGDPVKGEGFIYFEEVDFEEKFCVMVKEVKLDSDDAKDMIISFFKQSGIKENEMAKFISESDLQITDYDRYEYWYYPGIPFKRESKRKVFFEAFGVMTENVVVTSIDLLLEN